MLVVCALVCWCTLSVFYVSSLCSLSVFPLVCLSSCSSCCLILLSLFMLSWPFGGGDCWRSPWCFRICSFIIFMLSYVYTSRALSDGHRSVCDWLCTLFVSLFPWSVVRGLFVFLCLFVFVVVSFSLLLLLSLSLPLSLSLSLLLPQHEFSNREGLTASADRMQGMTYS